MHENSNISPIEAQKELLKLKSDLEKFVRIVGEDLDNVIRIESDPNQMFLREEIELIAYGINNLIFDLNYLELRVSDEGTLYMNNQGRYEINDYSYLTSGDVCELLVPDRDGVFCWLKTSIKHDENHGYYAVKLGREYSIDGIRARMRRK